MDVAALVERYESISQPEEADLLMRLTQDGWEAGCWIRPAREQVLDATHDEIAEFLERLRRRRSFARPPVDDPYPNGRPHEPIEGDGPCYVVLSQRCDIVGLLKAEPLVELAPATLCTIKERIDNAWRNSPREFPLDPRANPTHLADLRYRFYIAKPDLSELPPKQALPADADYREVRLRFALRAAQRYTRAAIPDRLSGVVRELRELTSGVEDVNHIFNEWSLLHGGDREGRPGVIAVYQVDIDEALDDDKQSEREHELRLLAEETFYAIIEALSEEAKAELDLDDGHRTRVVPETEHTVADWRLSWKLEWDSESFGGDPEAALPAR